MKRKLVVDASPAEQFHALRQIPGISAADCREVIKLLREDDKGHDTCHKQSQKFPDANRLLRQVRLPGANGLIFHYNSLPELVYEKALRCPLFAAMMKEGMKVGNGNLTLILFSDEACPGNVLHGRNPRKTNLVYASFLQMPCLFVDSMWVPLATQRAEDIATHGTSYAEVMRHLLEALWVETECGFPICIDSCSQLAFIDKVILLNDHEGLRSVTGPKAHYALHLTEHVKRWQRLIDCHVGERKHRLFKRHVGTKISRLEGYAKSVLLHLTEMELSSCEPAERLTGQPIGIPRERPSMAQLLKLQPNATFSSGFEVGCVSYQNGTYLRMSQEYCVEVQGGVSSGHNRYLLVATLRKESKCMTVFPKWIRTDAQLALLPLDRLKGHEPFRLIRTDATGTWLLR
eukprot:s146_g2.t1